MTVYLQNLVMYQGKIVIFIRRGTTLLMHLNREVVRRSGQQQECGSIQQYTALWGLILIRGARGLSDTHRLLPSTENEVISWETNSQTGDLHKIDNSSEICL